MQYLGGKARQARHISEVLTRYAVASARYVEPFMGGGAILERMAPKFREVIGSDISEDLMLMWQALSSGWTPPDSVSRDEYNELRDAAPSALRGFVGFGLSFGGKWFGGYASNRRGDDFCAAAKRGALRKVNAFRHADLVCLSYDQAPVRPGDLVYCDPPYAGTTGYNGVPEFDHAKFWETVRDWADRGASVFVSEYTAPDDVACVWERPSVQSLRKDDNRVSAVEKLFAVTPRRVRELTYTGR